MDLGGGDLTGRTMNMLELPDRERALRDDVRLVGRVLGDTVREQQGEAVFATVERIRQISIAFRREGDAGARQILQGHPELLDVVPAPGRSDDIDTPEDYAKIVRLFPRRKPRQRA